MTVTTVDIGTALVVYPHHTNHWHAAAVIGLVFVFTLIVAVTLGKLLAKPKPVVACTRCRHAYITDTPDDVVAVHCLGCHTDFALLDYLHHPCARVKVPA